MNNMATGIVEIVGPAGAGKTTLSQALSRTTNIQLGSFPDVRKISNAPFFIWNSLQLSPALLSLHRHISRKLTRREFAWLVILRGWPALLQREAGKNKTIILDQGPVYLLTETSKFGPEYLRRRKAEKMWADLYSRWAATLDVIIWLDAKDTDLLKRIRSRDKGHVVKNESADTTFEFFADYRKAYEQVISRLATFQPELRILRFDTTKLSTEEIANQLITEFSPQYKPLTRLAHGNE